MHTLTPNTIPGTFSKANNQSKGRRKVVAANPRAIQIHGGTKIWNYF
jgi:hypothetical protein